MLFSEKTVPAAEPVSRGNVNRLAVFHYHLFPGGVTGVLTNAVISLLSFDTGISDIVIITGREEHTDSFLKTVRSLLQDERDGDRISVEVFPELDYMNAGSDYFERPEKRKPAENRLEDKLLERFSDRNIWWIHNYHLGKNPLFTNVMLSIMEGGYPDKAARKFILQIHDFPECARDRNLRILETFVARPLYPIHGNIRYVLINERDRSYCASAGIPASLTVLLDNPVPDFVPGRTREENRQLFFHRLDSLQETDSGFRKDRPVFLYPVRSIRRKNVFEAILLSKLADGGANLIVTLPGVSLQEKPYSDLVERSFHEGLARGLFGTGDPGSPNHIPLPACAAASDLIVSSSVQEGFGYLFIDSVLWRKPLLARRLDTLTGVEPSIKGHPHCLYDGVTVPLGGEQREPTVKAYAGKLDTLRYRIDESDLDALKKSFQEMFSSPMVDFSYLSPGLQYEFLKSLSDPGTMKRCRDMNERLITETGRLLSAGLPADIASERSVSAITGRFGLKAFAAAVRHLIDSFDIPGEPETGRHGPAAESVDISGNLRKLFLRKENFRLLYD